MVDNVAYWKLQKVIGEFVGFGYGQGLTEDNNYWKIIENLEYLVDCLCMNETPEDDV